MKINLGCGRSPKKGYINCDVHPEAIKDKYVDVKNALPWSSATVDVVCCENLFDSLTRVEFMSLLREIHRILKPGGILEFHQGDVAVNPDMCIGWPYFVSGYTRYIFNYFTIGDSAYENWKDYWSLPGFTNVKIKHNDRGIMIGTMQKPS